MKLVLTLLIICCSAMTCGAQEANTSLLHRQAHRDLLANAAKSRLDNNVLQDMMLRDFAVRGEAEEADGMSAELTQMLGDLLKEARSHLGKRYRSGAKGPSAFDCSGFAGYVFRQFGVTLGASSRDQFGQGEKVERESLRPGDLVFFTGRNSRSRTVGHVGIVVTADNESGNFTFIHASTTGGIKIDGSTGYYSGRYMGARRVLAD